MKFPQFNPKTIGLYFLVFLPFYAASVSAQLVLEPAKNELAGLNINERTHQASLRIVLGSTQAVAGDLMLAVEKDERVLPLVEQAAQSTKICEAFIKDIEEFKKALVVAAGGELVLRRFKDVDPTDNSAATKFFIKDEKGRELYAKILEAHAAFLKLNDRFSMALSAGEFGWNGLINKIGEDEVEIDRWVKNTFDKAPLYTALNFLNAVQMEAAFTNSEFHHWAGQVSGASTWLKMPIDQPASNNIASECPEGGIAVSKMNLLYIGIDNPLEVSIKGVTDEVIRVEGESVFANDNGEYFAHPKFTGTSTITASATSSDGKEIELSKEFKNTILPDPYLTIAGRTSGVISRSQIKLIDGPVAKNNYFPFKIDYTLVSFEMLYISNGSATLTKSESANFTTEQKEIIAAANPEDRLYFSNVRIKMPDGTTRTITGSFQLI